MQTILSLDISTSPALIQVVGVDQQAITVLESASSLLEGLFSRKNLLGLEQQTTPEATSTESSTPAKEPSQEASQHPETQPTSRPKDEALDRGINALRDLLVSLKTPWTSSVVIAPPFDFLSLNLNLPFGTPKNIEKILDFEVQDRVPFEIDEFLLEHQVIGQTSPKNFDVHVGAIPKICISNILKICRKVDLDPIVLTTPSSTLETLLSLKGELFPSTFAFILERNSYTCFAYVLDGKLKCDRYFEKNSHSEEEIPQQDLDYAWQQLLASQYEITTREVEKRYGKSIDRAFLIDERSIPGPLQLQSNRLIEPLRLSDILAEAGGLACSSSFSAIFARDITPPPALSNFRAREFTYSLRLGELIKGLRRLSPYLLAVLACLIVVLASVYVLKENANMRLRIAMHETIHKVIPDLALENGKESAAIQAKNFDMEGQLKELGSQSKFSPLDSLLEISRHFPVSGGVSIRSLDIKGNQIKIEGGADNYTEIDAIEKALKARKNTYCRINKDISSSSMLGRPGSKGFVFDIRLCE